VVPIYKSKKEFYMKEKKLISNFTEWNSVNESVTPEQAEKVFVEAEKWSKATGIKIETDTRGIINRMGSTYIGVRDIFGLWKLELEKSTKDGRDDKKWYICFELQGVNSALRRKPGSFKIYKALVEEFLEVKKVFDKVSFFFEHALGIKKINTNHHYQDKDSYTVYIGGLDLKDLCVGINGMTDVYSRDNGWGNIDPNKVEILHKILTATNDKMEFWTGKNPLQKPIEETGKNFKEILEILEILKYEPLDKFLEETKSGDWKEIRKNHRGKILGKKFGL